MINFDQIEAILKFIKKFKNKLSCYLYSDGNKPVIVIHEVS